MCPGLVALFKFTCFYLCFSWNIEIIIEDVEFNARCVICMSPPKVKGAFGNSDPQMKELVHLDQCFRNTLILFQEFGYWSPFLQLWLSNSKQSEKHLLSGDLHILAVHEELLNDTVGSGLKDQEVLWHSFNHFSLISFHCRNRSQTVSSETSVDESGVFESLKAETSSPQQLFSGLAGIPSGTITATPFQSGLVLGSSAGGGEVFIQMPTPREEGSSRTEGAPFHHRQQSHHFHHGHHRGSSLLHMAGGDRHGHAEEGSDEQAGTPAPALSELKAVIGWLQKGLPFILILMAKVCFQHKLGKHLSFSDCKCIKGWLGSFIMLWCLMHIPLWQHLELEVF